MQCPPEKESCSEQIITDERLLLVTHPYSYYDDQRTARAGIDGTVAKAKEAGIKTVYLLDGNMRFGILYLDDPISDLVVDSFEGEHDLHFEGSELTLTGGYFGACFAVTLTRALHNRRSSKNLRIKIPVEAVFETSNNLSTRLNEIKDPLDFLRTWLEQDILSVDDSRWSYEVTLTYKSKSITVKKTNGDHPFLPVHILFE